MKQVPRALVVAGLAAAAAGCGSGVSQRATTEARLAGWRPVGDSPGISELAPELGHLTVTARTDYRALVRGGDAVRASAFTFATERQAREAQKRAAADDYAGALERAFHGDVAAREPGGYRLAVPRPAEPGSDTVEIVLVRRGRTLTVVELVSAHGFPPGLRARAIAAVSPRRAAG